MKVKKLVTLIMVLLGSMLIIVATWLSTVRIPKIESNISKLSEEFQRLSDRRERGIIFSLNYRQNEIKKRINILELNNFTFHNASQETKDRIKQMILNQYYDQINAWANLWTNDDTCSVCKDLKEKLDSISQEPDSYDHKINQFKELLVYSQELASKNLDKLHEYRNSIKSERTSVEDDRNKNFNWFVRFQITGLILLSISAVLEKTLLK